jgi:hypothetical protein
MSRSLSLSIYFQLYKHCIPSEHGVIAAPIFDVDMYPSYEASHFVDPKAENDIAEHAVGAAEVSVVQDFPASQRLHTVFPPTF